MTGPVCTLQQLSAAHAPHLEEELAALTAARPITLIVPCRAADAEEPAFAHLVEELKGASFLREILVSVNGGDSQTPERIRAKLAPLPQRTRVLSTDAGHLGELLAPYRARAGKGLNVWAALGLVQLDGESQFVATQDCDVASFRRGNLARLCYAAVHPQLGYAFAKMYYSRATDRLYGRVSRLFLAPLLQALAHLAGRRPLLDFLMSFRYPLAGECVVACDLAASLPMDAGWGFEMSLLCEVFRTEGAEGAAGAAATPVCQVDGGSGYDHRHQTSPAALARMAAEIAQTLFAHLAEQGCELNAAFRLRLDDAYRRHAAGAVHRSAGLALINGLPFDENAETQLAGLFAAQLARLEIAPPTPLPSWKSLAQNNPAFVTRFRSALE